jgi:hypothetical protein
LNHLLTSVILIETQDYLLEATEPLIGLFDSLGCALGSIGQGDYRILQRESLSD